MGISHQGKKPSIYGFRPILVIQEVGLSENCREDRSTFLFQRKKTNFVKYNDLGGGSRYVSVF